ncbi:MAG: hypothetical protein QW812_05805 [Thermoplasmataceae archaeon]
MAHQDVPNLFMVLGVSMFRIILSMEIVRLLSDQSILLLISSYPIENNLYSREI